jgi:ribosomal protein S18 acetylase RimI-like enzyme
MTDTISIRTADGADLDALVELNRAVQGIHAAALPSLFKSECALETVKEAFQKMMAAPGGCWLIAEAAQPCGYLYADFRERPESWSQRQRRVCNISHVAVSPGWRRRGVARQLVARVREEAARRGFERIELDVWSFNPEAKACFARLGFHVFNERMTYGESTAETEGPEP